MGEPLYEIINRRVEYIDPTGERRIGVAVRRTKIDGVEVFAIDRGSGPGLGSMLLWVPGDRVVEVRRG